MEPKRILIVDDDERVSRLLHANLSQAGYQVETAPDGLAAMKRLLTEEFDLMVSDVEMPEMDGLELLNWVRGEPLLRDLPVVMLTGRDGEDDMMQGLLEGADLYLNKPFAPTEIRTVVARLLEATE